GHGTHELAHIPLRPGRLLRFFYDIADDCFFFPIRVARGERRPGYHRHVEPDHQARPLGERAQATRDDFRRLADHFLAARPAEGTADAGVKKAQIIVDLRRRADRRSRVADAVLLPDGDRGADALDTVDVGLFHPLEELPGVGRQRLDVTPLSFRVYRVEGERRFARPADPGHHDERSRWQRQVHVLEIVGPGSPNDDLASGGFDGGLHLYGKFRQQRN